MAMGSMSYGEARGYADVLKDKAAKMDEEFNKLKREMNSLEEVLKSKGADELLATYKTLEAKLDGFPNKVRAFEGFLRSAVSQYEADDAALSKEVM